MMSNVLSEVLVPVQAVGGAPSLGFIPGIPGGWEWLLILVIGLLLFGRRLPEVGRSLGRSIVEFKKGVKGIEDEIDEATSSSDQNSGGVGSELPSGERPSVQADDRAVSREGGERPAVNG